LQEWENPQSSQSLQNTEARNCEKLRETEAVEFCLSVSEVCEPFRIINIPAKTCPETQFNFFTSALSREIILSDVCVIKNHSIFHICEWQKYVT